VLRTMLIAAVLAAVPLTGAAPAAAQSAACPPDARHSYARVELFRDSACAGASVSAGFDGSGDRPDFSAFTNYEGNVFDIDDTRDSLAVAPATCVRLFDGRGYAGEASALLCAPASADGLFPDLGPFKNRASSMRVCPAATPTACDALAAPPPPPPAPVANGSPASADVRLAATLRRGRLRQTVGFGRGAQVQVGITDASGQPIAGAALQVRTRELSAGAEWALAPDVITGPDGRASLPLGAGPSRQVRVEYRTHAGDAQPVATVHVRLDVRAGLTLRIRPRRLRGGQAMRLRGHLLAAPATRLGKIVTLQAYERGRWRDFKSTRTRRDGRFGTRYRFSRGARGRFAIRAVARADAAYPYATGRSRAVRVRVG
jgi:hypothetical protein